MVEINLLPWRIYQYEAIKARTIKYGTIFFSSGIIILLCVWVILNNTLRTEHDHVMSLQSKLNKIIKQNKFVPQLNEHSFLQLPARFQRNQVQLIGFFMHVVQASPEEIIWQEMVSQEDRVILTGKTASLSALLAYVKLFDGIQKPFRADLVKVKSMPRSTDLQFSMQFFQVVMPLMSEY